MKRNTDKLRHKHLPLAIAISAILAGQAHAENISGVEDSTDKTYNKTVQWFPNGQGNSLTWNNVIASGGLEAKALDQNNISITESVLNGLKGIYIKQGMVNSGLNIQGSVITSEKDGLVLEGVTNSIVNISNTEVHAGSSGIWIPAAKEGSIITLDTVNIDSMNKGVSVSELNGSTLDIQNDSVITSAKDGLSLGSVTDSAVNISNTEVHAGGPGISVTAANNSDILVNGSYISSGEKDSGIYIKDLNGSTLNIQETEVHAGGPGIFIPAASNGSAITLDKVNIDSMNKGVSVSELNGSTLDIQNDSVITSAKDGLSLGSVTDSAVNISNTEVHAGGPGISVTAANNSDILVNGSYISSGEKDSGIYIKDLNDSALNIQENEIHAGGPGIFIPASNNGSIITMDKTNIDSTDKGVLIGNLSDDSTLNIHDSVIASAGDTINLSGQIINSTVNISNTDITSSGGKGIRVNRMTNSELNISDTVINNSGDLALYANLNNATATINNSEFSGGVKFTGHDGDINVSDFRANGFELDATNMNVDIDHADIGKLHISGQFSSEEDHKSLNEVNISGSKLTYIGVRFGSGIGLGNTINVSDSEIIATPEEDGSAGTAIHFQDTQENTINVKDSRLTGNIHNGVYYSDNVTEEAGNTDRHNVVNLDNTYFEGALTLNLDKIDGTTLPGLGSTVNMNNSTWVAKDESTGENVNITNSVTVRSDHMSSVGTLRGDNLSVSATQHLTNSGSVVAQQLSVSSPEIINSGQLQGGETLTLVTRLLDNRAGGTVFTPSSLVLLLQSLNNAGTLEAAALDIDSRTFTNAGQVLAGNALTLKADNISNLHGGELASPVLNICGSNLDNAGTVRGEAVSLSAASVNSSGSMNARALEISSDTLNNAGALQGTERLALTVNRLLENLNGAGISAPVLHLTAPELRNDGVVEATALTADSHTLINRGDIRASDVLTLNTGMLDNQGNGEIAAPDFTINSDRLNNAGMLLGESLAIRAGQTFTSNGVLSAGELAINSPEILNSGLIRGDKTLALISRLLDNRADGMIYTPSALSLSVPDIRWI